MIFRENLDQELGLTFTMKGRKRQVFRGCVALANFRRSALGKASYGD
jgi:hypothetical protein